MTRKEPKASALVRVAETGPRGLGGYCWDRHAPTGLHCTEPVGHEQRSREHWHAYTKTRWT